MLMRAKINVSELNVRSGPGLSYSVVQTLTSGDIIYLSGTTKQADGYTWYQAFPDTNAWIAYTGGWSWTNCSFVTERILAGDLYGDLAWDHTCSYITGVNDGDYRIRCSEYNYTITCACGWVYTHHPVYEVENAQGVVVARFSGLDVNGDGFVDVAPGETLALPKAFPVDRNDYLLWEMYEKPPADQPDRTVTITFANKDHELVAQYQFSGGVFIKALDGHIEMTDLSGKVTNHYLVGTYLLFDRLGNYYLGDIGALYTYADHPEASDGNVEYVFTIVEYKTVFDDDLSLWDRIIATIESSVDTIASFFTNGFGLTWIFTDERSPFAFIFAGGLSGASEVWAAVSAFFDALPLPVALIPVFAFTGAILIFVVRWGR